MPHKPSGYVGKKNKAMFPGLERFIISFKKDTIQTTASMARRRLRITPNLPSSERIMIRTVLSKNVELNDSDKTSAPYCTRPPRDLYLEQFQKRLFDGKGTCKYKKAAMERNPQQNKTPCTDTHEMGKWLPKRA